MRGQVVLKINYLILFLLFSCIKLSVEDGVEKIEEPKDKKPEDNINEKKLYQIAMKNGTNLTYTKIEVIGVQDYIISYYKDDFKNRKQLSKGSKKAIMWLSKEQMKEKYNISVECNSYPCSFKISIGFKNIIELDIGKEPYTYYVTKENQNMEFHIKGITKDSKISLWVKGNKKVEPKLTKLKASHSLTKTRFHAYLFEKIEEKDVNNCTLSVSGDIGNLVEVGALVINGENLKEVNFPISGFLKKGPLENIKVENFDKNKFVPLYDQESLVYPFVNGSIKMNDTYGDEFFYVYDYKKKINESFYELSPLIHGAMYEINLENGKQMGLIPMTLEDNFEYLTYYAKAVNGKFKASIFVCNDYPLCKNIEKVTPLLNYDSSSYIFDKNDYGKDVSAISHKQNMLVLNCENGPCLIYVNMYTKNNKVTLMPDVTLLKNIKVKEEENFIISLNTILPDNKTKYFSSLNVEILSGDLTVSSDGTKYENGNKILFEKELGAKDSLNIKIKANKNSVYNLALYYEKEANIKLIPSQANCLIKFKDNLTDSQFSIRSKETKEKLFVSLSGFKSNTTTVEKSDNKLQFNEKRKFAQDSYDNNEKSNEGSNAKYKVSRVDKSNPYFYTVSTFRSFEEDKKNSNYVLLGKGAAYPVLFDENKNKKTSYMYLYEEEDDNLKINFTIFDDNNYTLEICLNDISYHTYNNITKNYSQIELNKDVLKKHSLTNQPCKVNFIVNPQKYNNNPIMEIVVNGKVNSGSPSNEGGKSSSIFDNKILLIGGAVILVLLIILIISIGLLCYTKNVNKDLRSKINTTSFQAGGTGPDDDREDDLLE